MSKKKDYSQINYAFEKAVIQMQDDLQFLVNKGNVSNHFVSKQNRILKALIDYQQATQYQIKHLENAVKTAHLEKREQVLKLKERIVSFEAICIIHGIMDFPMWLSFGKVLLIDKAVRLSKANKIELADVFKEKLNKLPKEDKKLVEHILFKELNTEIQAVLEKMNKRYKTTY